MEDLSKRTEFSKKLADVESFITWRYVSIHYFDRKPVWVTERICGKSHDGNTVDFTDEEKEILKGALVDMADRLRKTADALNF